MQRMRSCVWQPECKWYERKVNKLNARKYVGVK